MVTFTFLCDQLKQSIPRLFHSLGLPRSLVFKLGLTMSTGHCTASFLFLGRQAIRAYPQALILFLIISKVGEVEFFVSPVFLDFDPGFEEDLIS